MPKSPAFQFYAADYLADENVQLMTLEEEGAYVRALAYCWREGSIPSDLEMLCKLLKNCSNQTGTTVQRRFVVGSTNPDRMVHPRLELEREKQREWSEKSRQAGIVSGKSRKNKALQNEPTLNHRSNLVEPKANSSSSSSSSNNPLPPFENSDQTIFEIAHAYPKLSHLREGEIPQSVQVAIIEAIGKDGAQKVLSGVKAYARQLDDPKFAARPYDFFAGFQYRPFTPKAPTERWDIIAETRKALLS